MILSLVEPRPRHGYEISQVIETRSEGDVRFKRGLALSAALPPREARLDRRPLGRERGPAAAPLLPSDPRGTKVLAEQRPGWQRFVAAIGRIYGGRACGEDLRRGRRKSGAADRASRRSDGIHAAVIEELAHISTIATARSSRRAQSRRRTRAAVRQELNDDGLVRDAATHPPAPRRHELVVGGGPPGGRWLGGLGQDARYAARGCADTRLYGRCCVHARARCRRQHRDLCRRQCRGLRPLPFAEPRPAGAVLGKQSRTWLADLLGLASELSRLAGSGPQLRASCRSTPMPASPRPTEVTPRSCERSR